MPVFGVSLFRAFPHSDWIRIEILRSVSLLIQRECGKIRTRKSPNTDIFDAVKSSRTDIIPFHVDQIYCGNWCWSNFWSFAIFLASSQKLIRVKCIFKIVFGVFDGYITFMSQNNHIMDLFVLEAVTGRCSVK